MVPVLTVTCLRWLGTKHLFGPSSANYVIMIWKKKCWQENCAKSRKSDWKLIGWTLSMPCSASQSDSSITIVMLVDAPHFVSRLLSFPQFFLVFVLMNKSKLSGNCCRGSIHTASAVVCQLAVSVVIKAPSITGRILLIGLDLVQLSEDNPDKGFSGYLCQSLDLKSQQFHCSVRKNANQSGSNSI